MPVDDYMLEIIFKRNSRRYTACNEIPFEARTKNAGHYSLVTVLAASENEPITITWLREYLRVLQTSCDVYSSEVFLDGIVITDSTKEHVLSEECVNSVKRAGTKWAELIQEPHLVDRLTPGPYLYLDGVLRRVYRLYDDTQGCFLTGLRPKLLASDQQPYIQLSASESTYGSLSIAVPSRAPKLEPKAHPHLRVVVKDLFQLKGLKTSLNDKSYYDVSLPSTSTAPIIESLRKDGAHILGMTKLSSMIAREEPLDAVDFPTCFNPRGDGYQSPAGSSSGSAAAVAAYEWVDVGIGSDTSGSGRRPAMANGVWQFRPSHGLVNCEGMVKTWPGYDTPCVFARDFGNLERVLRCWIPRATATAPGAGMGETNTNQKRYKIIVPTDYFASTTNLQQLRFLDAFIEDLRLCLPATVSHFSIRDGWTQTHPPNTDPNLDSYLQDVITRTYYYSFYHSTTEFRQAYTAKHDGKRPYVIPFVQRRWAMGEAVTEEEHEEAKGRLEVYKNWLHETFFGNTNLRQVQGLDQEQKEGPDGQQNQDRESQEVEPETLVILPIANLTPTYRDQPTASPETQSAVDGLFLPPILGAPDVVVPVGEAEYESRITGRKEYLPVVVDVMGRPGRDWQLLDAIGKVMKGSGRVMKVEVGRRMFPGIEK
ncbi:amidase signature domain-containing protein [Sordaria brevicollis]|uniref:Amidase signature domain-containing protein n=1 Tax=Sordaria brevicollis TaxID=83679 RepID=A0AAE0U530_SORBR|nr:amidase signature domain-containing protein [Sordaria brevicollis]